MLSTIQLWAVSIIPATCVVTWTLCKAATAVHVLEKDTHGCADTKAAHACAALCPQIAAQPAVAGWGPRSFLTGFAVYSGPISGSVKSLMIQNHSTIASAATRSAPSAAAGSELHPLDQCGGEGGLCSATSIGIPCGDHQWGGAYCSENFNCSRSNSSWWSCELVPGR